FRMSAANKSGTRSLRDLGDQERALLNRWRLVLGKSAEQRGIGFSPGSGEGGGDCGRAEEALSYLFDDRGAGSGSSALTVPRWMDSVNELFPRQAKEVLER